MDLRQKLYDNKASISQDLDRLGIARYQKALSLVQLETQSKVLDIGCRRCPLLHLMNEQGNPIQYTGIDIAEEIVERNQTRWPEGSFVQGDITAGTVFEDDHFDYVFAMEVMEHVPAPASMLQEVHRVLKPEGRLLLSVPNPFYYLEWINEVRGAPDTEGHIYAWADNNLRKLLEFNGFEAEERVGTYLEIPTRMRGAWQRDKLILLQRIPAFFSRSRVYRCKPV